MKKGFTLIELLAVILILGIIALIAIPAVTNVIEDSKKNAAKVTALSYIKAIDDQNALYKLQPNKYTSIESGDVEELIVNIKGDNPTDGTVTIENGKVKEAEFCITGYNVTYENKKVTIGGKCGTKSCKAKTENYEYTGDVQEYTVPCTGTYRLEVWGAQGADASVDTDTYTGGKGGYSVGNVTLTQGDKIDIVVGGQGGISQGSVVGQGGYNGGGTGAITTAANWKYRYLFAGGGATHIAIHNDNYDVLSSYGTPEVASSFVYLVAGGGGSGSAQADNSGNYSYANGGSGGGTTGGKNIMIRRGGAVGTGERTGGTQTACGTGAAINDLCGFGQGYPKTTKAGVWAGGGGWYGGNTGAGGSGHINTSLVTNGSMVCYNCMTASDDITIVNECYDEDPVSNCSKQGNGYAKITYIGN